MPMTLADVKEEVQEKVDGRSFAETKYARWTKALRRSVATDFFVSGFHGLYFLFRIGTYQGGSVADGRSYVLPDDFISDLTLFFDKTFVPKAPPGMLEALGRTEPESSADYGTPTWWAMAGQAFKFLPPPSETGKEIKMLYYGYPDDPPAAANDSFTDHFLDKFFDLHVWGIAEKAAASIGADKIMNSCTQHLEAEKRKLHMHNISHWLAHAKLRFQNWDEFEELKTSLFPQFLE